jgi:hypothetical protein
VLPTPLSRENYFAFTPVKDIWIVRGKFDKIKTENYRGFFMKLPEDIRLLLIVILTMGCVAGVAALVVLAGPAIGRSPELTLRVIIAILFTFVTLKFFLYILEAATVVFGRQRGEKITRIKSAHPALRATILVAIGLAAFIGYYFLFECVKKIF